MLFLKTNPQFCLMVKLSTKKYVKEFLKNSGNNRIHFAAKHLAPSKMLVTSRHCCYEGLLGT